jgi:hypothetical protein
VAFGTKRNKGYVPKTTKGVNVSRYDKYDPKSGGFRAPANVAWTSTSGPAGVTDLFRVTGVMLNGSGRLVRATSAIACVGITIAHGPKAAGDILDVMTDGEVVELDALDLQAATAPVAGTRYYLDVTAGRLTATAPAAGTNAFYVGTTVEASRLVVRCGLMQG